MFLELDLMVELEILCLEKGDDFFAVHKFVSQCVNDRGFGVEDSGIGFKLILMFALTFDDSQRFFFLQLVLGLIFIYEFVVIGVDE